MTTKIKVFVERGCVETVWTNRDPNRTEVEILDKDGDYRKEAEATEAELEHNNAKIGEWAQVWP